MDVTTTQIENSNTLIITPLAKKKIDELLTKSNVKDSNLRIYLEKVTCSGCKYNFMLDKPNEEDLFITVAEDLKIIIDPISFSYINGYTLNYIESVDYNGFIIESLSESCCGCNKESCC